jgi:type IV secretory pathway component VirB8
MNCDKVVTLSIGYYILFRTKYNRQSHEYEGALIVISSLSSSTRVKRFSSSFEIKRFQTRQVGQSGYNYDSLILNLFNFITFLMNTPIIRTHILKGAIYM